MNTKKKSGAILLGTMILGLGTQMTASAAGNKVSDDKKNSEFVYVNNNEEEEESDAKNSENATNEGNDILKTSAKAAGVGASAASIIKVTESSLAKENSDPSVQEEQDNKEKNNEGEKTEDLKENSDLNTQEEQGTKEQKTEKQNKKTKLKRKLALALCLGNWLCYFAIYILVYKREKLRDWLDNVQIKLKALLSDCKEYLSSAATSLYDTMDNSKSVKEDESSINEDENREFMLSNNDSQKKYGLSKEEVEGLNCILLELNEEDPFDIDTFRKVVKYIAKIYVERGDSVNDDIWEKFHKLSSDLLNSKLFSSQVNDYVGYWLGGVENFLEKEISKCRAKKQIDKDEEYAKIMFQEEVNRQIDEDEDYAKIVFQEELNGIQ